MVRAPCCEKMGLKRGPWTAEEDQILVSYIQRYGHGNWRALPKLAGLLRCGKSCRLRWMNYLRPDIKRGSFSKEEEETIINLHELLGNRWSAIAARLPGRTDNEIKNVWHTHLKKRVLKPSPAAQLQPKKKARRDPTTAMESNAGYMISSLLPPSPPESSSELSSTATDSSSTATRGGASANYEQYTETSEMFLEMDESFWSEALSLDGDCATSLGFGAPNGCLQPSSDYVGGGGEGSLHSSTTDASSGEDDIDFWLRMFMEAGGVPELPSF